MNTRPLFAPLLAALMTPAVPAASAAPEKPTPYRAEGNAIVGHNLGSYHNRPLFINNTNAFVLAGDRPIVRLGRGQQIYGAFLIAFVRGSQAPWLHLCDEITATYRANRMTWTIRDARFAGTTITLDIVPMAGAIGMVARLVVDGGRPGDKLVWGYGGTVDAREHSIWNLNPANQKQWFAEGFVPEECRGSIVRDHQDGVFSLTIPLSNDASPKTIAIRCSVASEMGVADAAAWRDPVAFARSTAGNLPLIRGTTSLDATQEVIWAVEAFDSERPGDLTRLKSPAESFAAGVRGSEALAGRVTASTPEPRLDALLSCAAAEVDGAWYPPVFVHGTMAWNMPFPGWLMIFGGTVCGWHERVKAEAEYYIASQVKDSTKSQAKPDPATRLCLQHPDSRYYGRGRILKDQAFYNMQTPFFEQIVYDWRWTADPELERLLRPALELHLEWARDCFDPDGDGTYESYINTWPTDSVWYNGGGSAEETAYVYRGHKAALDMARRAGDGQAAAFHAAMLKKIKEGFFSRLWIQRTGHAGKYREQGGLGRLHEDPWLYSIFLPIDAGLLTPEQAAGSLYYTEWGLQNDRTPFGGRRVWTSNWVPGIWSVRPLAALDYVGLSLAYFQAGFAEDGWEVLQGATFDAFQNAPAAISIGGASIIYRATVEGLFGYSPDYPNSIVRIAPQLPVAWDQAAIRTPDVALRFQRQGETETLGVELARPAALELRLPVRAKQIAAVTVDGRPTRWEVLPGFGHGVVQVKLPESKAAAVVVTVRDRLPQFGPARIAGHVGQQVTLAADGAGARVVGFSDPQGTLADASLQEAAISGRLAANVGHHTAIANVQIGDLPQRRLFRMTIDDPAAEAAREAKLVQQIPKDAVWETIDLGVALNADVRTIYQQQYLSPRQNTVSVRIGSDGYSPWTFPFWDNHPPAIRLDQVPALLRDSGNLHTPQGVPFVWPGEAKNIAFTSLWDNWPARVTVPVGKRGEALWMLVCGSTNPMQCHIANAVVKLRYADGQDDALELVPPDNYWSLCPLGAKPSAPDQHGRSDYDYTTDAFCLPKTPPPTVQLGENCRAMVLNRRTRHDVRLEDVTLETLSQDVVVGLMGLTLMNPE